MLVSDITHTHICCQQRPCVWQMLGHAGWQVTGGRNYLNLSDIFLRLRLQWSLYKKTGILGRSDQPENK